MTAAHLRRFCFSLSRNSVLIDGCDMNRMFREPSCSFLICHPDSTSGMSHELSPILLNWPTETQKLGSRTLATHRADHEMVNRHEHGTNNEHANNEPGTSRKRWPNETKRTTESTMTIRTSAIKYSANAAPHGQKSRKTHESALKKRTVTSGNKFVTKLCWTHIEIPRRNALSGITG